MVAAEHEFSPIVNNERLEAAIVYVAENSLQLALRVLGRELPINTICFFAQSEEEYAFLEQAVRARGPESELSHGLTLYVDTDFKVGAQRIRRLGVRRPDETRQWVGYGDYPVADYERFWRSQHGNVCVHQIVSGRGQPLLELRHPEFDVLGFVVDERTH